MAVAAYDFVPGRKQPTPKDMFSFASLAKSPVASIVTSTPIRRASPPHIPVKSKRFGYALAIVSGYSHEEACADLQLNPRTVERWRGQLRAESTAWFGFYPPYELCARFAVHPDRTRDELRAATAK